MNSLLQLLSALCIAEFVHNMVEIWGMRQKVQWLEGSIREGKHGRWPININTKTKTIALHAAILLLTSVLAYLLLQVISLTDKQLIGLSIVVLAMNYIFTTYKVDKFHSEIGKLIREAKAKFSK